MIADKGHGDQYGIANPKQYTIKEVAEMISDQIQFISENVANRMSTEIVSKKVLDLGWKPNIELSDYIKNQLWAKDLALSEAVVFMKYLA